MDIKVKRQPLLEKLSLVIGLTESNSPNDILKNILIRGSLKKKEAFIAATDLESTIVSFFRSEDCPKADFDILVPAQIFMETIRNIDTDEVTIKVHKNNWMEVVIPSAKFKFPYIPGSEFPNVSFSSSNRQFNIPASSISNTIPSLLNFSSKEISMRNLNGVLFEPMDGKIRLVATDSRRLAYFQRDVGEKPDFEKVVLSRKAVAELAKIVKSSEKEKEDQDGNVHVSFDKEKAFFKSGDTTVISTPVDIPFPEYTRAVPDISSLDLNPAVTDRNKMLGTVRRVSVFSHDSKRVDVKAEGLTLSFTSGQTEYGEGIETIALNSAVDEAKASFNPEFIVDSLNFLDGADIEFRVGDGKKPAVMKMVDNEDFFCVLMPLLP